MKTPKTIHSSAKAAKRPPIHPGEILIEEFLKLMGISATKFSKDLRLPSNHVSEIVSGKRSITADTARRLGKYFGVSPETWTGLQADYEIRKLGQTKWPAIESRIHAVST